MIRKLVELSVDARGWVVGITLLLATGALVLAVISGALIGESIGFALGRFFGPRIRMSRLGRWLGEQHKDNHRNATN